jgi:hypothetical protein
MTQETGVGLVMYRGLNQIKMIYKTGPPREGDRLED